MLYSPDYNPYYCNPPSLTNCYQQIINSQFSNAVQASQNIVSNQDIEQIIELQKENKELKKQIEDIIEQEDEKQKVLKIIAPSCLKNNINAGTVIVYGNVSGDISAENVVCMQGNINSNNIKANKIFSKNVASATEKEINKKQQEYRKKHPSCKYCAFKEKGKEGDSFEKIFYPSQFPQYLCSITNKIINERPKIRARFCSFYKPAPDEEK